VTLTKNPLAKPDLGDPHGFPGPIYPWSSPVGLQTALKLFQLLELVVEVRKTLSEKPVPILPANTSPSGLL